MFAPFTTSPECLQCPVLTNAAPNAPLDCKPDLAVLPAGVMPLYQCVHLYPEGRYTICSCGGTKLTSSKVLVPLVPP